MFLKRYFLTFKGNGAYHVESCPQMLYIFVVNFKNETYHMVVNPQLNRK